MNQNKKEDSKRVTTLKSNQKIAGKSNKSN